MNYHIINRLCAVYVGQKNWGFYFSKTMVVEGGQLISKGQKFLLAWGATLHKRKRMHTTQQKSLICFTFYLISVLYFSNDSLKGSKKDVKGMSFILQIILGEKKEE